MGLSALSKLGLSSLMPRIGCRFFSVWHDRSLHLRAAFLPQTRDQGGDSSLPKRGEPMEWISPDFEEVSLCCEINCYATAEL